VARRRSLFRRLARSAGVVALALASVFVVLVAFYAFAPPVSTLMLARMVSGKGYSRIYTPLSAIAPSAVASVIASEDARFCSNDGVDWGALHEVLNGADGPRRGASTITMQVAKNLFLWPGRSVLRKGIEIPMALVLGKVWSKARTIEVYLEAAARHHFHKNASELNAREAALLATALPNPVKRDPARPSPLQRRHAAEIMARAQGDAGLMTCLPK
jgi:monofunctional biosynthetic peptidoglycan transglycosylase